MIKNLHIVVNRIGHINRCLGEVVRASETGYCLQQQDLNIEVLRHTCKLLLKDINLVFGEEDDEY